MQDLSAKQPDKKNTRLSTLAIVILALITLGALGLRVANLGRFSLWLDEAAEASFASREAEDCWQADVNVPPLNRMVVHFWTRIFGTSEVSLRFPSVIFGTLCVPALFFLGRRLFDGKVAWLGAVLIATRPFAIEFSQEARQYPLLVLLAILATYFFVRHMDRPSLFSTAGYAACITLGMYTFYLFAFLILAHLAWYLALGKKTAGRTATLLLVCVLAAAAYAPWMPMLFRALGQQERGWIADLWGQIYHMFQSYGPGISAYDLRGLGILDFRQAPVFDDIWSQVLAFAEKPIERINATISIYSFREILVITGFIAPLLGGCAFAAARNGRRGALLIFAFFLPLAVLSSIFWWVPMVTPRYMQFILPAYILATSVFLARMWRNPVGIVVMASMVVLLVLSLVVYYFSPAYGKEDYRGAVEYVAAERRNGDIIMCYPGYIDCAVRYYYKGAGEPVRIDALDTEGLALPAGGGESGAATIADFARRPDARLWVVVRGAVSQAEKDKLKALLERHFSNTEQTRFEKGWGVDVFLFYNRDGQSGHPTP